MRTLKQRFLSVVMSVMLVLSVVSGLGFSSAAEDGLVLADGSDAVVDEDESMVYVPGGQNYLTADYLKSQFESDIEVDPEYNELFNGYKIKCAGKEYTVCIKGDVDSNGKITAADAQAILEISGNEEKAEQYGEYALKCADVNSDGKVTLMESRSVYRTAARMTASVLDSVNDIATDVSDEDPVVSFGVALGEDRGSFDLNISLNNIKNHFTSRIVLEYPSDISVLRCSKNYNGFFDVYAPLGNNKAVISLVSIDKIADDEADVCTVSFSVSDDYDAASELEISLTDESCVDDVIPVSGSVKFSLKEVTENEPKFKYEAISDNEICITGYSGNDGIVEIPEEIDGFTVTKIGDYAFDQCAAVNQIVMPDSITAIGEGAFSGCSSLEKINIPNSVEKIDNYAFNGCFSLEEIDLSGTSALLESGIFCDCSSLKDVKFPEGIEQITSEMFKGCNSLESITIPDSVTEICDSAFRACWNLTDIVIPESVDSIGDQAFMYCSSLKDLQLSDGLSSIGEMAFSGCSDFESVILPDSVSEIGAKAFENCDKLTSFIIPADLVLLNGNPFVGCTSLTDINTEKNQTFIFKDGVLFAENGSVLTAYLQSNEAAEYIVPDGVTVIDVSAFELCDKLESITLPDSVSVISNNAFDSCSALKSFNIPGNIKLIDSEAFANCPNINKAELPASLEYISYDAFDGCSGLAEINVDENNARYISSNGVLYSIDENKILEKYPEGKTDSSYSIENDTQIIQPYAFAYNKYIKEVIVSSKVTSIDEKTFYNCPNLVKITIPASVEYISDNSIGYKIIEGEDDYAVVPVEGMTIFGYAGTAAQEYAEENGFIFKEIDSSECKHENTDIVGEMPATCTEAGYTGDKVCSDCGFVVEEGKDIPAAGHKFENGVCTVCGYAEPGDKSVLADGSILTLDTDKHFAVLVPQKVSGMTIAEFKAQFACDIELAGEDSAPVANGMKFKLNGEEYTAIVKGDVNGDGKISATDARLILRISAKLERADDVMFASADINGDGKAMAGEARRVLRFSAKLEQTIME